MRKEFIVHIYEQTIVRKEIPVIAESREAAIEWAWQNDYDYPWSEPATILDVDYVEEPNHE